MIIKVIDMKMEQFRDLYIFEESRIESFKFWPFGDDATCNKSAMAKAGFYWCGSEAESDSAACFLCGKTLDGWEEKDDPWSEHRKHAPQCAFAKMAQPQDELTLKQLIELFRNKAHAMVSSNLTNHTKRLKRILHEEQSKSV